MSDHKPLYETADAPMHNVEKHGYNAVPHQIVTTPPPPPPANAGSEGQGGGGQGSGDQGSGSSSSGSSEDK